ncbi:MAG TPA: HU family DNA-binding protein [Acidimicrobiia bacterium]|nr:HU family DNA-binding protein [Acidimicrobiia bacterium]
MNKKELGDAVAEALGGQKAQGGAAVDAVFDAVAGALAKGDKVSIAGFGGFEVRQRSARMGRNPRTGEAIPIKASKAPAFKPAKALKEAVNTFNP